MANEVIGAVGVGLILFAFLLNLFRRLSERHPAYLLLNAIGAGMACWYAWIGGTLPFVILEGVWCLAALVQLVMVKRSAPVETGAR
ncbi:MAG: hypothetical protein RBT76_01170 [candidate division Zixibacteria bacterium]|jgi:hypothetical protein|nr:hypothetical protein [candidate division Zixibacteria bacterium]